MPYKIVKDGDCYNVVSKDTDRIVARHEPPDAEEKAKKQVHLLEAVEHDPQWKPTQHNSRDDEHDYR
jgi:hypothetical protein